MRAPARFLAFLLLSLASAPAALAADPPIGGALTVTGKDDGTIEMPLRHTRVSIEVTAFVARATVEQVFSNPFDAPVEAVYTFPLGDRAAVDDFELTVGERTIRGEIKRREEAEQDYAAARAAGYQAALLEQERPNIFTQSVANLEPGKSVTVRLRTIETARYERGSYRIAFPLVVAPRYIPARRSATADAARVVSPVVLPDRRSGHDVELDVTIDAGTPMRDPKSASHRIVVERRGATSARVRLAPGDTIPNKDFQLQWSVASDRPSVALLAHRDGLDGFFTLLVQPKAEIGVAEATPKELTLVVDTSGSMSGIPLEASKRFIAAALHELGRSDTFNIVRFSGDNEVFSKDPLPNSPADVERAIAWVNAQMGGGGTEMLAALEAAFARPIDPNRLRVVVFFTDGAVGDDDDILAAIGGVLGDARIYTVGIGSSVNRYLLDRMADLGRGAFVVIRPDEHADDALEAFRSWVTRPYLTDLTVDWGALPVVDVSPDRVRDLGSGQTLTLVGRYLNAASGDVVVRGKLGGHYWEQRLRVVLPDRETKHEALASLWARGRVENLLLGSVGAVTDSVRAEVTSLALDFRLMSPFTSFIAVDDSVVVSPTGTSPTIRQPLPVPDGTSFGGIFGANGPAALDADDAAEKEVEDAADDEEEVAGGVVGGVVGGVAGGVHEREFKTTVSGIGDGDPLTGQFVNLLNADATETVTVVSAAAGATFGRAQGGFAQVVGEAEGTADAISDSRVAGRFYQNVIALPQGVSGVEFDDDPDVELAAARARLREAAFQLLADLADDGRLSVAEGKPALAALLAAQIQDGAIAQDVATHALATWALAEAARALPNDTWVGAASAKSVEHLAHLASPDGWPKRPDGQPSAEATAWARLVLGAIRPTAIASVATPPGGASNDFLRLRDAISSAQRHEKPQRPSGRTAFDRLVATIGRGHLMVVSPGAS